MEALIRRKKSEGDQEIVLRLLEQVAGEDRISQAKFAKQIGIAKGLANAYFNRCVSKGWIKLHQVPKQRYLYYLTPKGFAEKARLTVEFLSHSYQFYRTARDELSAVFAEAAANGHTRLIVLGSDELAEIAALVSQDSDVEIVGFIADAAKRSHIAKRPVSNDWAALQGADATVLADVANARKVYEEFSSALPDIKIYVPHQLRMLIRNR